MTLREEPKIVTTNDNELAKRLFPDNPVPPQLDRTPPAVASLRNVPERKMFSAQKLLANEVSAKDHEVWGTRNDKDIAELREMFADLELSSGEINSIKTRAHFAKNGSVANINGSVDTLNRQYGEDAGQTLLNARALLRRDPRATQLIQRLGLDNDPETIMLIAAKARSAINAGKLKPSGRW